MFSKTVTAIGAKIREYFRAFTGVFFFVRYSRYSEAANLFSLLAVIVILDKGLQLCVERNLFWLCGNIL